MGRWIVGVEGSDLPPLAYEVRRYRAANERHALALLDAATPRPGDSHAAWRLADPTLAEWSVAFAGEATTPEKEQRLERLGRRLERAGGVEAEVSEGDALALIRRRLRMMQEDVAAGRSAAPGWYGSRRHYGAGRGALLDAATGELRIVPARG